MLDEIIEIMKKKPEIIEDEPKEFKVVYDDIDLPVEEDIKEFKKMARKGNFKENIYRRKSFLYRHQRR